MDKIAKNILYLLTFGKVGNTSAPSANDVVREWDCIGDICSQEVIK